MYLLVVHNCGHRSGGHHGEGVDDIFFVDFEWYVVPISENEVTIGIVSYHYVRPKQRLYVRNK